MSKWTEPYYGVQHLIGTPKEYQITVEEYATFSTVAVINLRSPRAFSSLAEAQFDNPQDARLWGERENRKRSRVLA